MLTTHTHSDARNAKTYRVAPAINFSFSVNGDSGETFTFCLDFFNRDGVDATLSLEKRKGAKK